MKTFWSFLLFLVCLTLEQTSAFNPIKKVKCFFYECCQAPYLTRDFDRLESELSKNLYGQPLVLRTVVPALRAHFELKNPKKALVMSFHGSSGVGKNYVANHIINSLYQYGVKSRFFKSWVATKHFTDNSKIFEYKEQIKKSIEDTVRQCRYSLFLFDEIDKIPIGLLDVIKAYIDFNHEVDGLDFRNSVFIFLSNSASGKIAQLTLELDKKNKNRNDFELKPFQKIISEEIYFNKEADDRGMFHGAIIDSFLIDYYIPFLPMERSHVKMCARQSLRNEIEAFVHPDDYMTKHFDLDVDYVADQMIYEPPHLQKFSSAGCKRVPNIVKSLLVIRKYAFRNDEL